MKRPPAPRFLPAALVLAVSVLAAGQEKQEAMSADCSVWSTLERDFELLANGPIVLAREASVDPETARTAWLAEQTERIEPRDGPASGDVADPLAAQRAGSAEEDERRWRRLEGSFPELERDTIDAYLESNRPLADGTTSLALEGCPLSEQVLVAEPEELAELFQGSDPWPRFYRRFPEAKGLARLSQPGFNRDRSQALVYVSKSWGALAGEGHLLFLRREPDGWKIAGEVLLWIS